MANLNIYLVAQYVARPKDSTKTAQPGYMTNPENIEWDERMYITQGIRKKDEQMNVILDLTEEKIIKNSFESGKKFNEMFEYFYEACGNYIDECITTINETNNLK